MTATQTPASGATTLPVPLAGSAPARSTHQGAQAGERPRPGHGSAVPTGRVGGWNEPV